MNLPHISDILISFAMYRGLLLSRPFTKNLCHFIVTADLESKQELGVYCTNMRKWIRCFMIRCESQVSVFYWDRMFKLVLIDRCASRQRSKITILQWN